jgi:hypothetical protein
VPIFIQADGNFTANVGTSNLYLRITQNGTPLKTYRRQVVPAGVDYYAISNYTAAIAGVNTIRLEVQSQFSGSATEWESATLSYLVVKR